MSREALLEQRARIAALKRELGEGLRLLHGVELNLGPEGELDYDAEFRRTFDWCVASVHSHFELDAAAQTRRLTRAMREPEVRMIGHPAARVIGGRPPIAFDAAEVLRVAGETGTLLEVNGALPRLDCSVEVLRQARGKDVRFMLCSDAHHTAELGLMSYAIRNAERAWLESAQVVNAWPAAELRRCVVNPKP